MVFDSNIRRHHHVIDEDTGKIYEMPWNRLKGTGEKSLKDFQIAISRRPPRQWEKKMIFYAMI